MGSEIRFEAAIRCFVSVPTKRYCACAKHGRHNPHASVPNNRQQTTLMESTSEFSAKQVSNRMTWFFYVSAPEAI